MNGSYMIGAVAVAVAAAMVEPYIRQILLP